MSNRSTISRVIEETLSAGVLLSLCALIILGPKPKSNDIEAFETSKRSATSEFKRPGQNVALETIRNASKKNPNQ